MFRSWHECRDNDSRDPETRFVDFTFTSLSYARTEGFQLSLLKMVLIVGEHLVKEVPSSTSGIYTSWPRLKETAHALTSMLTEEVGPHGLLYLRQREYAVTVPRDENLAILGTDDATTSVMAVLRHTGEYLKGSG
ncbi:Protein N-terminal asparagine amidohydrolase [Portunus trituberculatus]|uniref:Protein N-terminal asparagine amidohydrolase n=1 Tax=Portunus trituberculatus TaxID=210409 RepID=A0A5B7FI97_PORTR|nr:Protein N-terminal asparagine amidohydrolase [Portunus trituberculatus]